MGESMKEWPTMWNVSVKDNLDSQGVDFFIDDENKACRVF
jgi:hypothetical protein